MADQARPTSAENSEGSDAPGEPRVEVLLGLGANLGSPLKQLREAVRLLEEAWGPLRISSVYRSDPVGHADQPEFYNLVVAASTAQMPRSVLTATHRIEQRLGRERSFTNAPRSIDIDLLAYGGEIFELPDLVIPHPRLHQRGFVLHPLVEVAPDWRHPVLGRTAAELLAHAGGLERIERVGPLSEA